MDRNFTFPRKLALLSDINGLKDESWLGYYKKWLKNRFELKLYDVRELAEIAPTIQNKEEIHQEFIHGGIDRAVKNLQKLEKEPFLILGFSIGGTIGWRAALDNPKIVGLIAISSTRLRYEEKKPEIPIKMLFGEDDPYKPAAKWFLDREFPANFLDEEGHEFYKKKKWAERICEDLG